MKPALLTLSFLLLFALPLAFSYDDAEPVLDYNNNPVVTGTEYYISIDLYPVVAFPPAVVFGIYKNQTCAVTVVVDFSIPDVYGKAVKFSIPGSTTPNETVYTDTPLQIEFAEQPLCASSPRWIVFRDNETQRAFLGIGGPVDHPGQPTISGTFIIPNATFGYSLKFGVPILVDGSSFCSGNTDRYIVGGPLDPLVLTKKDVTFHFYLKKADSLSGIRAVI